MGNENDTDISVSVSNQCGLSFPVYDSVGYYDSGILGHNDTDFFSGTISNTGNEDVELFFNLSIYPKEDPTLHPDVDDENDSFKPMPLDSQPSNYTFTSELPTETQDENNTQFENFLIKYVAAGPFSPGNYTGEAFVDFVCNGSIEDENGTITEDTDGNISEEADFEIIELEADGDEPDEVADEDDTDFELDVDALIERLKETGELDTDINDTEDGQLDVDAIVEALEREAELDTDVDEEQDADPQEGDSDAPGQTPEPEPEPEPDPDPRLEIEINPVNQTYDAVQGQFAPAALEVENFADDPVEDFELDPLIDETNPDWEVETADIGEIEPNETLEREVFVQPPIDAEPGMYTIPVTADDGDVIMDIDYFNLDVEEAEITPFIEIIEAPETVTLEEEEQMDIPILVENVGDINLTNVEGRLQNMDSCGTANVTGTDFMDINDTASLDIQFNASDNTGDCDTTLIVSSEDGAYSFSDIEVTVVPEEGLLPREQEVPIVAISWTLVLVAYAVMRKKYDLNTTVVNLPFILLIIGQTFIVIYLVAHYYGLVGTSLLPF